jgi:hypothetical protein
MWSKVMVMMMKNKNNNRNSKTIINNYSLYLLSSSQEQMIISINSNDNHHHHHNNSDYDNKAKTNQPHAFELLGQCADHFVARELEVLGKRLAELWGVRCASFG